MSTPNQLDEAIELHQKGELPQAAARYQEILENEPENADAWHLLGVVAHQQDKNDLAARLINNAIGLKEDVADFHSNLGRVQIALGDEAAGDAAYRRAVEINPHHVKALSNLAGLLRTTGQFSAAVDYARRAVAAGPDDPEAQINLGNALKDINWTDDAVAAYTRAIELAPDYALAHWNLSLALLTLGQYETGFKEMMWRWRWGGFPAKARDFEAPQLQPGDDISGKRILLHAEQGIGDTLHFIRYAEQLRKQGAHVIFECPGAVRPLIEGADLTDDLVAAGDGLPKFDLHAALLDLPYICRTSQDTLPQATPYLTIPFEISNKWQTKVASEPGLKIGLNWAGNPESPVEHFRGLPPADLLPLAALENVTWFSLQKGNNANDVPALSDNFPILDTGPDALIETAGLIQALDLIITSDTAIAHLAGALNKPVWILLHHAPDWRWLTEGDKSAWYPSARLFRQRQPGGWKSVIEEVLTALKNSL